MNKFVYVLAISIVTILCISLVISIYFKYGILVSICCFLLVFGIWYNLIYVIRDCMRK